VDSELVADVAGVIGDLGLCFAVGGLPKGGVSVAIEKLTIQNQIRAFRFAAGEMTQQDLADKVGVSRQTINAIEASKYFPSLEVAFRIARVFGKPLDEVFECVMKQK